MRPRNPTEDEYKQMLANMGKVGGGVDSSHKGRKLPSAPDLSHVRPSKLEGARLSRESAVIPAPSPYKSKLEAQYAAHLELLLKAGEIRRWAYEPMSLKLADGKRYRPDFLVVLPLGAEAKAEMHEVKGRWTKNRRDGMTHLKWAAQLYGDVFTFRLIEWKGHGFDGHYITA